jgi:hypothetical protein
MASADLIRISTSCLPSAFALESAWVKALEAATEVEVWLSVGKSAGRDRARPRSKCDLADKLKRREPAFSLKKPNPTQRGPTVTKVLVLYYSAYGHIETMANAVAEGAREAGATVDIKRVPELVPPDVAKASHYKVDQAAPVAKVEELAG